MNDRYLQLVTLTADADVQQVMEGQAKPFPDVNIKEDVNVQWRSQDLILGGR